MKQIKKGRSFLASFDCYLPMFRMDCANIVIWRKFTMHRIILIKGTVSFGRIRDLVAILPDFFGTEFEAVQIHPFIPYLFPIVVV